MHPSRPHINRQPEPCSTASFSDFAFAAERPNPHTLHGAIVGGPDREDVFLDRRQLFTYTEVALDYNTGLSTALAAAVAVPPDFWAQSNCGDVVQNYPWPA